ncbi:MAG TPA: DHHA2 domain-containing protein [bacterium]|nr:DHHA2 domain-containing protein [bacterium]
MAQNTILNTFLESAADAARTGKPVRAYIGNEASDLDSMATSVLYAWLKGPISGGLANVPVMNIPREDFNLRTEAVWLFKQAGIDPKNLVFLDDIDLGKILAAGKSRLVLVDHNKLSAGQTAWADWVEEIVDHHADEGLYPAAKKNIAPVGSASTLVAELMVAGNLRLDPAVATLALGTILLDTVNLDPEAKRVTPRDEAVAKKLLESSNANRKDLFDSLQFEKFNVAALSTRDILRKDYKEYKMGSIMCGMSSALLPLADWFKKDTALEVSLKGYAESRRLDVLIVMNAYTAPDFTREMAVHTKDAALRERLVKFMNESGVGLVPLKTSASIPTGATEYFSQADLSQSRKKLQPLLSDYLSRI